MLFITSHYSQVKMHAYSDPMMLNASMEFDEGTDRPTFRVIEGLPGDSHAIAIAKRMGLPSSVIRSARENMTSSSSVSRRSATRSSKASWRRRAGRLNSCSSASRRRVPTS